MQDVFTAGRFLDQAGRAVQDVVSRGKVPIVVGGTSMYTQWLVQGKPDAPKYVRFQHVLSSFLGIQVIISKTSIISVLKDTK